MATHITVVAEDDETFTVESDGQCVQTGVHALDDAVEVASLLLRCQAGDKAACAQLDAMGLEPPMLELDDQPIAGTIPAGDSRIATRSDALVMIGVRAAGKTIVGLDVDRAGIATLRLNGGCAITLHLDGQIDWEDEPVCPTCRNGELARESAAFPHDTGCPTCSPGY